MASPRVIMPQVQVPATRQGEGRVGRRPETHFELRFKPFQIQPFCLFPVLPGETLINCNLQTQMWSDPLKAACKNQIWHHEAYFYYVKFRDLPGWEDAIDDIGKDMIDMIESGEALTSHRVAAGTSWSGCPPYGVDYAKRALERVVECYWRDEGKPWDDTGTLDGVPLATVYGKRRDVMDRLTRGPFYADRRQNLDWDASGTITVDDIEMAYREWVGQKDGPELDMDYEDWVRAAGGKSVTKNDEREDLHLPEELTGVREYTYPSNTVEPTTGTPSVAVGVRWRKGMRKMFRFEEWGWVLGVMCVRPKLLSGTQFGMFADMMQTRDHWFPPNMDPRSWSPHMNLLETEGPLAANIAAGEVSYWINLRDLLKYGEQFTNYNPVPADGIFSQVPNSLASQTMPSAADCMASFSDTTAGRLRASGVVQMGFKTHKVVVASEEPESMALAKW